MYCICRRAVFEGVEVVEAVEVVVVGLINDDGKSSFIIVMLKSFTMSVFSI